jgi:serpin B
MARNVLLLPPMAHRLALSCLSSLSTLLVLAGCSGSASDQAATTSQPARLAQADVARDPASAVPASALSAAVLANNAFAVDLYSHVRADPEVGTGNVLTSPISASLALTMTYAGAKGQTASEMASALHLGAGADGSIFAGQNALSQALNARGATALAQAQSDATVSHAAAPSADDYQLQMINSVWGQSTYTWEPPFLQVLAKNYGTGVYQEDFVHDFEPARLTINAWVSDETKDKINDLLPAGALDAFTRMVLVNAIHLKFPWATAFDPAATAAGTFTREDATTVSANFMNLTNAFGYVDDGQAQIAALPMYNNELSVVIALPHEGVSLASYEATLTDQSAPLVVPQTSALLALSLPKTDFTSPSFSLRTALKAMGMNLAFDHGLADLTGLCAEPPDKAVLYVSDVLQKATLSLQETGGEAAAATAVVVAGDISIAVEPPPTIPMIVNRPYLVEIVDVATGAVLMLGHVEDPTATGTP